MGLAIEMFLEDKEMEWLKEYFNETGRVVKDDTVGKQIKRVLADRNMLFFRREHVFAYREAHAEDYN